MAESSSGEKTEEPTHRRKTDARKQGTVAKSADLTGALTLMAVLGVLPAALAAFGHGMVGGFQSSLSNVPRGMSQAEIYRFMADLLKPTLLLFLTVAGTGLAVGLASNFLQVGFTLSAESMQPKFEKINPVAGFKRLFSQRALVEGLKTLFKGVVFGYMAFDAVRANWINLIRLGWFGPAEAATHVGSLIWGISMRVGTAWLILAALDYMFQRQQVNKQLKMTKDEVKREMKEQEGSPEVKAARMQRMRKLSRGRIQESVRKADVIITNPTHFSVAIQYDRSKMHAPMIVAKGQDYLALKIREIATENKVPIIPNPPLARALYKECEVGDFVPREMFGAVAEVLAFVYRTIKKLR